MKTTKEQINEVINALMKTARMLGLYTSEEVRGHIYAAIIKLQAAKALESPTTASDNYTQVDAEAVAAPTAANEALEAHNARLDEVLQNLERLTSPTPTSTNTDKALFLFRRISALKAEKAKCSEEMGAKWFNSTLADKYGNAILEEIEKLA